MADDYGDRPFHNPKMTNVTTNKKVQVNVTVPPGGAFTVDMEHRTVKYVLSGTTIDAFENMTADSEFWYLVPEENTLHLECVEPNVAFSVNYRSAFIGA